MLYILSRHLLRLSTMSVRAPRSLNPLLVWGFLLWALSYMGVRIALEAAVGGLGPVRMLLALAPLPFFLMWLVGLIREARGMDELQRRIQFEALGLAFPLTLVLVMTLGLIEDARPLDRANWSFRHVWQLLVLFYVIGLFVARRRYRYEA